MKQSTREYIDLPVPELENRLQGVQDEIADLHFQLATRRVTNYARLKVLRKQIARLKFFIDAKKEAE